MDISSVQKLCIHLISSAYQRCRLSEDLCRLSVVLESTQATPIIRVSISDTGTGSCLEEFQDLKYNREGIGTEKWDGLLSIKTTGKFPCLGPLGIPFLASEKYIVERPRFRL
ncbi:hypothetical protein V6N13_062263 [Hibiscus sabdariffa]|uniref:Uncharacterized protein n=1 Tax=Hibiscus sabdariffa TaxID=183260 RepID=A0ABR2BPY1_9ROSI